MFVIKIFSHCRVVNTAEMHLGILFLFIPGQQRVHGLVQREAVGRRPLPGPHREDLLRRGRVLSGLHGDTTTQEKELDR